MNKYYNMNNNYNDNNNNNRFASVSMLEWIRWIIKIIIMKIEQKR